MLDEQVNDMALDDGDDDDDDDDNNNEKNIYNAPFIKT